MSLSNPINDPIITANQPDPFADPSKPPVQPVTFTFLSNIAGPSANIFQQIPPDTSAISAALSANLNVNQARANLAATAPSDPPPASSQPFWGITENPSIDQAVANFFPTAASVGNEYFASLIQGSPRVVLKNTTTISFGGFGFLTLGIAYNVERTGNSSFNNFPVSLQQLISQYQSFVGVGSPVNASNPIFQAFFNSYLSALGILTTSDGALLASFQPPVGAAQLLTQFEKAMDYFLMNYTTLFPDFKGSAPANSDPNSLVQSNLGSMQQFLDNWASYMTQTATLTSAAGSQLGLPSYQDIWNASGLPDSEFAAALQRFYKQTVASTGKTEPDNGFFIPSQALNSWTDFVQKEKNIAFTKSTVSLVGSRDVVVINRILFLLAELIGTLQNVSAAQAGYLNFLTAWQTAYTNLLADMPTFVPGDGTVLGDAIFKQSADARNNISAKMQALSQKVSSRQSAVGDQAKSMQALINQSQANSNQAVDMASAFLSEISTIVQAIFSKAA